MSYKSISDLLKASEVKPRKPKPKSPLMTTDGKVLPEVDSHPRAPGDQEPMPSAIIDDGLSENPYRGRRCAIRFCREAAQYSWKRAPEGFDREEIPELPPIRSTDPLVAQIEAAQVQASFAAVIVPEPVETFLCIRHSQEFEEARNALKAEEAAARVEHTLPLWEYDYSEGARVDMDPDGKHFTLHDAQGRSVRMELWQLQETMAYMSGRKWNPRPLTASEVESLKARVGAI